MAFPFGWKRRITLTINRLKVGSGGVTNFSVLLTRASFGTNGNGMFYGSNAAQADGGDIRFTTDLNGTTLLPCDIIAFSFDSSSGAANSTCQIRVKVPSLSTGANTIIYVWYNADDTQTQPAANSTYGQYNAYDSNFVSYWTLDDLTDRSSNQNTLTAVNSPTLVAAKIGKGYSLNGTNAYLNGVSSSSLNVTGQITMSAWINAGNTTIKQGIFGKGNFGSDRDYYLELSASGPKLGLSYNVNQVVNSAGGLTIPNNQWNQVGLTLSGAGLVTWYVNGVVVGTTSAATITTTGSNPLNIGMADSGTAIPLSGSIDSVILNNTARSSGWMLTEYNQTSSPQTFVTAGTPSSFFFAYGHMNMTLRGVDPVPVSSGVDLFMNATLTGFNPVSGSIPLFMGNSFCTGGMNLYVSGNHSLTQSGVNNMNLFMQVDRNLVSSNVDCFMLGDYDPSQLYYYYLSMDELITLTKEDYFNLVVGNTIDSNTAILDAGLNLFLKSANIVENNVDITMIVNSFPFTGGTSANNTTDLYMFGASGINNHVNLFMKTKNISNDNVDLFIRGYNPSE